MQCCGKRGRFIHFPFSARDSLGMPTKGGAAKGTGDLAELHPEGQRS
jgi:hypothetical protein